jgi:hypothetical protein
MQNLVLKHASKLTALAVCIGLVGTAQGQTDAKKRQSRLEIGQKKEPITINSKLQLVAKPSFKAGEIRYNSSSVYNQYIKSKLLNGLEPRTTKVLPQPEVAFNAGTERSDKLFHSENISVSTAFPNPASENTTIEFSMAANIANAKIIVRNLFGSPVATYNIDSQDRKLVIPTDHLASGVYTYQLIVDGQLKNSKKLLVRHQ